MAGTKLRWHVTKVMARLYRGTVVPTVIFRSTAGTAVPLFFIEPFGATQNYLVPPMDCVSQNYLVPPTECVSQNYLVPPTECVSQNYLVPPMECVSGGLMGGTKH
jgi:hypothetical protein